MCRQFNESQPEGENTRMNGQNPVHVPYWSPLATARSIVADWGSSGDLSVDTDAKWAEKNWLNVPGPFYTGETDTGMNGPVHAPRMILCGEDGMEFVYRHPRSPDDVRTLLEAAWGEPMGGYAWDGDERWTPDSVRSWWADRSRLRTWIADEISRCSESRFPHDQATLPALREFSQSLDGRLPQYLRGYIFWLTEGREPAPSELLPPL
ncbi:ferredoxin [Streptacidiphilus sp. P02-A3a]|uniref:ferredoxin n=1 Tax=Streptacidiphilus sp. P02-A3a TaxID=2704468 RepID=UPI0015FC5B8B|nr:ferredoxin [Streptacidiphilus sp. P02-A3a]QMU71626.1 ferredoxin [Streptacidiphilus sp. P02-A3a]